MSREAEPPSPTDQGDQMKLELYSPTTAKLTLEIKDYPELLAELREHSIYTTKETALQLNNYLNFEAEEIDGSVRLNDMVLTYFGYDTEQDNNGVYDYIIKQTENEGLTTFSIHNRGSFMYDRLLSKAF